MAEDFIARFQTLHAKATLNAEEQPEYDGLKERFATALCVAQQIMLRPGQTARQTFRVAVLFKVQLTIDGATQPTVTMDVSMGGFSAIVSPAPRGTKDAAFKMTIKGETIEGKADIVSAQQMGSSARASFRITAWAVPNAAQKLERALFDAVVARFGQARK